ncbi:MAG: carbohydrate-binding family 9-like protein [Anaerolineae bacterium]|nr:carbohydrate-binding family 9-like protein [Anaerolineae bacterium]MDQ7034928.1 carbohydrate-binding family 9-like protein [Anaerolineae bacterium]
MTSATYDLELPLAPKSWREQANLLDWDWEKIPTLSPFMLADNSQLASQQTVTRVCCDQQALYLRFDCQDTDIWGTFTERDEPIYDEEAVELFLGHGEANPVRYYEFEVSPNGVLFDAQIVNPSSNREDIELITAWDCPDIQWYAKRDDANNHWTATLIIPWVAVAPSDALPKVWRANFYRIERPRDAPAEFSCWSPTMTVPIDFHKPAYFGILRLPDF